MSQSNEKPLTVREYIEVSVPIDCFVNKSERIMELLPEAFGPKINVKGLREKFAD